MKYIQLQYSISTSSNYFIDSCSIKPRRWRLERSNLETIIYVWYDLLVGARKSPAPFKFSFTSCSCCRHMIIPQHRQNHQRNEIFLKGHMIKVVTVLWQTKLDRALMEHETFTYYKLLTWSDLLFIDHRSNGQAWIEEDKKWDSLLRSE